MFQDKNSNIDKINSTNVPYSPPPKRVLQIIINKNSDYSQQETSVTINNNTINNNTPFSNTTRLLAIKQ